MRFSVVADVPWLVPLGLKFVERCPRWISRISAGFKTVYEVRPSSPVEDTPLLMSCQHCRDVGDERLGSSRVERNTRSTRARQTVLHLEDETPRALRSSDVFTLFQQAAAFLLAGTTPAITLVVACFYILKSPNIQDRLREELDELDRSTPGGLTGPQLDWRELTRSKYLVWFIYALRPSCVPSGDTFTISADLTSLQDAVIKESLRIIAPIPGLLPRVVPMEGMEIGPHSLPGGVRSIPNSRCLSFPLPTDYPTHKHTYQTRISAALSVLHHNETVFPNPHQFQPERWLQASPSELQAMEQCFMPFSKGARACIGSR